VALDERPLHSQVRDWLREVALATPIGERSAIPTESELAERMGVSRGTIRKAVDTLVGEGLLVREQGRGTFVHAGAQVRRLISGRLAAVAKPDSRFDDDFESFIPDFEGSERCVERLAALPIYQQAETLFVSRDNNLRPLRERALGDGKRLIVPSHALRTGLRVIESVPKGMERFAAMLDGLEEFGRPIPLEQVAEHGPVSIAVTGAVAVTREGIMFGARHDYFRIEVAVLAAMNALADGALTIGMVHDCQVVELADGVEAPHGAFLDLVITPSEVFVQPDPQRRPPQPHERLDRQTVISLVAPFRRAGNGEDEQPAWVNWLLSQNFSR
jgi:5-formyltetrahydrofolate cyclo-ligase